MTTEEHEAIYRHVLDAVNRQDVSALDRLLDQHMVDHNPIPGQAPGREGFKQWMTVARTTFPDLVGTIEDVFGKGDRVAGRVTWRGTKHGAFLHVQPTGKLVVFQAIHIVRVDRDKIVEWWGEMNALGVLHQVERQAA